MSESRNKFQFILGLILLLVSSSFDIDAEEHKGIKSDTPKPLLISELSQDSLEIGKINAVKKAYQMTDLKFTPINPIGKRNGTFEPGMTYKGVMYSSTNELETYVGKDISIHTLMTAIHNPRSKIYTEDISKLPYHGKNGKAYYGSVCSSFVSHALGLVPRYYANDFPLSDMMQDIIYSMPEDLQIADVLWKDGHVAMITDIRTDNNGQVTKIESSECAGAGCKRYYRTRQQIDKLLQTRYKKVLRYKQLYRNTNYTPFPQFVAVFDETPVMFKYNDDLCVDKGDKSCYLENEDVVVNIFHDFDCLEIYKDDKLYQTFASSSKEDVTLSNLSYGNYKARIYYSNNDTTSQYSDYTYWKVVNVDIKADRANGRIYFRSTNATQLYLCCCSNYGKGGSLTKNNLYQLSDDEIRRGFIEVTQDRISPRYPFIRIIFQTDYAKVINNPVNWFE